jgi:hypothetical protein
VRATFQHHQLAALDGLMQALARDRERKDPVGITLNNERGHVDARDVFTEVGQPGWDACRRARGGGANCDVPVVPHDLFADPLAQCDVEIIEV